MVAGYAIGGGHVLHLCCDLTIAADNARFGQTGPRVGSFDGGYGIGLLARQIGEKRAKEVWFLCRQYDAATALDWGLVNAVVPLDELEPTTLAWANELLEKSPLALRLLKSGYNAGVDGLAGSNTSPVTPRSSTTCPRRRRKAATPSRTSAPRLLAVPEAAVTDLATWWRGRGPAPSAPASCRSWLVRPRPGISCGGASARRCSSRSGSRSA